MKNEATRRWSSTPSYVDGIEPVNCGLSFPHLEQRKTGVFAVAIQPTTPKMKEAKNHVMMTRNMFDEVSAENGLLPMSQVTSANNPTKQIVVNVRPTTTTTGLRLDTNTTFTSSDEQLEQLP